MTRLHRPLMTIKLCYTFLYLDHDKFPLLGSSIWPLLPETQIDLIVRSDWCLTTLLSYHTCTANKKDIFIKKNAFPQVLKLILHCRPHLPTLILRHGPNR